MDRWRVQLQYPPDFRCLGFNAWLANNDSVDKAELMSQLIGRSLNVSQVTPIYSAVTGCPHLLINTSCLYSDDNNSTTSTFSTTPMSDFVRALLLVHSSDNFSSDHNVSAVMDGAENSNTHQTDQTSYFINSARRAPNEPARQTGLISADNVSASMDDAITAALCYDASSCFALPTNRRLADIYVRVLSAYVAVHLTTYAFHRAVYLADNDLVVTRSQSSLALGQHSSGGILEHYVDEASASNASQLVNVYNCYDAILAVSNGHWECESWIWFAHVRIIIRIIL